MIFFFFFNYAATTEIYTLSLHDALPISANVSPDGLVHLAASSRVTRSATSTVYSTNAPFADVASTTIVSGTVSTGAVVSTDRKSTRLNSSHANISYAVFCLKKKYN